VVIMIVGLLITQMSFGKITSAQQVASAEHSRTNASN
jgi:hypothetical protein